MDASTPGWIHCPIVFGAMFFSLTKTGFEVFGIFFNMSNLFLLCRYWIRILSNWFLCIPLLQYPHFVGLLLLVQVIVDSSLAKNNFEVHFS